MAGSMAGSDDPEYAIINNQGRKEVLELLNTGGEIASFFLNEETMSCPLVNANIGGVLGKGVQGTAYAIKLGDGNSRNYVVKVSKETLFKVKDQTNQGKRVTVGDLAAISHKEKGVPIHIFVMMNGGDPTRIIRARGVYKDVYPNVLEGYTPGVGYVCKTTKDEYSTKLSWEYSLNESTDKRFAFGPLRLNRTDERFVFPKGSYLCDTDTFPEYINGLLCSSLLERGECINFLHVFGFGLCNFNKDGKSSLKDYTFMEKIDGDINSLWKKLPQDEFTVVADNLFIQVLFAISIMNRRLGIQHNDLHTGNVFYEKIDGDKSIVFDGQTITKDTKFLEYIIDGERCVIPFLGYIAKIGDFGFSVKYSIPMVGSKDKTYKRGYIHEIPAWRDDSYDMLFFTRAMYLLSPFSPVIGAAMSKILGGKDKSKTNLEMWYQERPSEGKERASLRPLLKMHPLRPWNLLKDGIVKHTTPSSRSGVVRVGTLGDESLPIASPVKASITSVIEATSPKTSPETVSKPSTPPKLSRKINKMKSVEGKFMVEAIYYKRVMGRRDDCIENLRMFSKNAVSKYGTLYDAAELFEKSVIVFDAYCSKDYPDDLFLFASGAFMIVAEKHGITVDMKTIQTADDNTYSKVYYDAAKRSIHGELGDDIDPPCASEYLHMVGEEVEEVEDVENNTEKMMRYIARNAWLCIYPQSVIAAAVAYIFVDTQEAADRVLEILEYSFEEIEECYDSIMEMMETGWTDMYEERVSAIESR